MRIKLLFQSSFSRHAAEPSKDSFKIKIPNISHDGSHIVLDTLLSAIFREFWRVLEARFFTLFCRDNLAPSEAYAQKIQVALGLNDATHSTDRISVPLWE